ncbi:hypothetical protein EVAR_17032_1 [Eumeta japonica]|uniref:Uncharacterized protein n=1 Tax=Eumeta variegata TaxID=151549 RepID=A0A4C1V5R1_EUMVA|nr:hypothetical protein EVAR_17032_1 [Eumeta japonica]
MFNVFAFAGFSSPCVCRCRSFGEDSARGLVGVAGLLDRNAISDEVRNGLIEGEVGQRKRIGPPGTFTQWTKGNGESCYITRVLKLSEKLSLSGLVLGSLIVSGRDKFPYRGIGSSRLDYGDEVLHLSHLVQRRNERRTGEVYFGTLNMYEGINDKNRLCLQTDEKEATRYSMCDRDEKGK